MRESRYKFKGGPLDGVVRRKTRPARNPLFRDAADGGPLPVALGDRFARGRGSLTELYAQSGCEFAEDGAFVVIYVHKSRTA